MQYPNNTKVTYEKYSSNQIEDDGSEIRQVIFYVNDMTQYTFDVNKFISFHNLKKILAHAARLPKNTFRIYHESDNVDYTKYEDETLNDFFPNDSKVIFKLFIDLMKMATEENFDLKLQDTCCEIHPLKFKTFYCQTCQKSFCYTCIQNGHMNHLWKEKIDLLAPAELLIREIFRNKEDYKVRAEFDKTTELISFKMKMQNEYFDYLKNMINQIQIKFNDLIDSFNYHVKKCEENVNSNIILLQTYSQEAYILLKNDINTKGIVNNDEIYKILDKKLNEIAESKNILTGFAQKYIEINTNYTTIKNFAEKFFKDIVNSLQVYTENKFYDELNILIKNQVVQTITKEQVINRMFNDVDVDRKSLNKRDNNLSIYKYSVYGSTKLNNNYDINNNKIPNPFDRNNMSFNNSEPPKNNSISNLNQTAENNKKFNQPNFNSSQNNRTMNNNFNYQNNNNFDYQNNNANKISYVGNTQPNFSNLVNNNNNNSNSIVTFTQNNVNTNNPFNNNNNGDNFIYTLNSQIEKNIINNISTNEFNDNIIMFPKEGKNIIIYNKKDDPITINFNDSINKEISEFQTDSAHCNYKNILYIAGGRNKGKLSTKFLYFDPSNENRIVNNYNDSNFSHINGTMIGYKNYIYLIGGKKNKKCERFNLETKQWSNLPDLKRETESPILFVYKNYLYAFFGINSEEKIMNTVERLNLNNTKGGWDNVLINNPEKLELHIYGCGTILTKDDDDDDILCFLGGKTENELTNSILMFNFSDFSFSLLQENELEAKDYFKENLFHKIDSENWANYSNNERILVVNIPNSVSME
jgi:hypothetical protein